MSRYLGATGDGRGFCRHLLRFSCPISCIVIELFSYITQWLVSMLKEVDHDFQSAFPEKRQLNTPTQAV